MSEAVAGHMSDPHAIPERMYPPTNIAPVTNEGIASGLEEIGRLLPHDVRSHQRRRSLSNAAQLIRSCVQPVTQLIEERGVEGVHMLGIDYELSGVVTDWVRCGRLAWLERLKAQRLEEIARLPSIGPRLAQDLHDVLGVVDLDGLAEVAREGRLANVVGFGPKRIKLVASLLAARASRKPVSDTAAFAFAG